MATAFAACPGVEVRAADLLAVAENAIVSPANTQGFMDGGIDRRIVEFFGPSIETDSLTLAVAHCLSVRSLALPVS